jgi:hypothetical protein
MRTLLEKALERVQELPAAEQDAIARMVLDELESERKWDELFAKSPEKLAKLAGKAKTEFEAGKTELLDLGSEDCACH